MSRGTTRFAIGDHDHTWTFMPCKKKKSPKWNPWLPLYFSSLFCSQYEKPCHLFVWIYFHIATNCGKNATGQDMTKVSGHFIRGNDREKFASTLVNFMGKVCLSLFYSFIYFYVDWVGNSLMCTIYLALYQTLPLSGHMWL